MQLCLQIAAVPLLAAWVAGLHAAEPIPLSRAEATFHAGRDDELAQVIDGVEAGPHGWSVTPRISESQALVVRCAQLVEAAELDFTLFFLSGRPNNSIAEFALDYTTDAEPSLQGNWRPLEIQRFTAEVATLQRTTNGHLRASLLPDEITGVITDDTYRVAVILPGGRATGFRLRVFPVFPRSDGPAWMSWGSPHDFVLTEFRVQVHNRESTNIALHRSVKASHRLNGPMLPDALTDGLPATIAHPMESGLGTNFHFDIDLGRIAALDHIGLRTRGDGYLDRFSRLIVQLYEKDPESGGIPVWEGMDRADGSHPEAGMADIVLADWAAARVPQLAWEYNCPVSVATGCQAARPQSFLKTSDNVIVEALRRDGADIELRVVEVLGQAGTAEVTLNLPHTSAALTDLTGARPQKLAGGPTYKFPVRPQQIVTLRFRTDAPVAAIKPLMEWDELVPPNKRAALHEYLPDKKGHPPARIVRWEFCFH
jgi:hypothetical protein